MRAFDLGLWLGAALIGCVSAVACGGDDDSRATFQSTPGTGGTAGDSSTTSVTGGGAGIAATGGTRGSTGGNSAGGLGGGSGASGPGGSDASADSSAGGSGGARTDGGSPTKCQSSIDCPAGAPVCIAATGLCLKCNTNGQCAQTEECVGGACQPLKACTNSRDCVGSSGGRTICDQQDGVCVECNADPDCGGQGKICSNHRCVIGCTTDNQCTASGLLCNPTLGACTECVQTSDCPAADYCDGGACVPDTCVAGARTCSANAVYECNTTGSAVSLVENCGRRSCVDTDGGASCSAAPPADAGSPTADASAPPDAGLPAHCSNAKKDSDETDVDCGGADCAGCVPGKTCKAGTDCTTLSCGPSCVLPICQLSRVCLQATCTDAVKNGEETGPDCGGPTCPACPGGEPCKVNSDCASNVCAQGKCTAPTCVASQCPACTLTVRCCTAQDACGCVSVRGGTCN
jgi:hypothetical protein